MISWGREIRDVRLSANYQAEGSQCGGSEIDARAGLFLTSSPTVASTFSRIPFSLATFGFSTCFLEPEDKNFSATASRGKSLVLLAVGPI